MPPVESEADRQSFFDTDEFAVTAVINGVEVDGQFDEQTSSVDDIAEVSVQSSDPSFLCSSSSLPDGLAEDTEIEITREDGSTFEGKIRTIEPDGHGLTMLMLESD